MLEGISLDISSPISSSTSLLSSPAFKSDLLSMSLRLVFSSPKASRAEIASLKFLIAGISSVVTKSTRSLSCSTWTITSVSEGAVSITTKS